MTRLKAMAALPLTPCPRTNNAGPRGHQRNAVGASISRDGQTVNFAVYSAHATHIQLCLFASAQGANAVLTRDIEASNGNGVWSTQIPMDVLTNAGLSTVYYGYRAWGPNWA